MTTRQLAEAILELRQRQAITLMHGDVIQVIGHDALSEALNRRWLVTDHESTVPSLRVTTMASILEEIQSLAVSDDFDVGDQVTVGDGGESFTGVVQSRDGNGFKVSFKPGHSPKTVKPVYAKADLRRIKALGPTGMRTGPSTQPQGPFTSNRPALPGLSGR